MACVIVNLFIVKSFSDSTVLIYCQIFSWKHCFEGF